MADFKIPETIPQDLLLIYDIVGQDSQQDSVLQPPVSRRSEESIESSDSDGESEDEIEAELRVLSDAEPSASDSSPSLDTSGSDSESEVEQQPLSLAQNNDDDEEPGQNTSSYLRTKNEVSDGEITVPSIQEVEPHEPLEYVGDIMSIVDNVVIVKGRPSDHPNRASQKALDSDTILVFENRKVMGYIYETFGPTSQPLYQVKFSQNYPIDPDLVRISCKVFHVPQRSKFVFVERIKHLKGSDASNVHDEEPAEDEVEFSDDEAEATYKSSLKQRRRSESRAQSAPSSRHTTPGLVPMHDLNPLPSGNAFDEHGPYDVDYNAGPSRPAPAPYDDPYAEPNTAFATPPTTSQVQDKSIEYQNRDYDATRRRGRGRGRKQPPRDRGRGGHRNLGTRDVYMHPPSSEWSNPQMSPVNFSPQFLSNVPFGAGEHRTPQMNPVWQHQTFPSGQQELYSAIPMMVQPHINPRFASALGFNFSGISQLGATQNPPMLTPGYDPVQSFGPSNSSEQDHWTNEWTVQRNDG